MIWREKMSLPPPALEVHTQVTVPSGVKEPASEPLPEPEPLAAPDPLLEPPEQPLRSARVMALATNNADTFFMIYHPLFSIFLRVGSLFRAGLYDPV